MSRPADFISEARRVPLFLCPHNCPAKEAEASLSLLELQILKLIDLPEQYQRTFPEAFSKGRDDIRLAHPVSPTKINLSLFFSFPARTGFKNTVARQIRSSD